MSKPLGAMSSPYGLKDFAGWEVPHGDRPASEMRKLLEDQHIEAEVQRRVAKQLEQHKNCVVADKLFELSDIMNLTMVLKTTKIEVNENMSTLAGLYIKLNDKDYIIKPV